MRALLVSLALLSAGSADNQKIELDKPKPEKVVAELDGYYVLKGSNAKEDYSGIVTIRKVNGVYAMSWQMDVVNHNVGVGFRRGDMLVAACSSGQTRTALMYKIEPGPTLRGEWTSLPGDGRVHQETLTFLKALDEMDGN